MGNSAKKGIILLRNLSKLFLHFLNFPNCGHFLNCFADNSHIGVVQNFRKRFVNDFASICTYARQNIELDVLREYQEYFCTNDKTV